MARDRVDESGLVEDRGLFKELWDNYMQRFPNAPIEITIRNFNKLTDVTLISIKLPESEAISIGLKVEWGTRIYCWDIDLAQFLSERAMDMLRAGRLKGRYASREHNIPGGHFVKVGQKVCNLLGRELTIDWRSGGATSTTKTVILPLSFPKSPAKKPESLFTNSCPVPGKPDSKLKPPKVFKTCGDFLFLARIYECHGYFLRFLQHWQHQ